MLFQCILGGYFLRHSFVMSVAFSTPQNSSGLPAVAVLGGITSLF